MADPKGFQRTPNGVPLEPAALAPVPSDWGTVRYVLSMDPHPDDPTTPILSWVTAGELISESLLTEDGDILTEGGDVITE